MVVLSIVYELARVLLPILATIFVTILLFKRTKLKPIWVMIVSIIVTAVFFLTIGLLTYPRIRLSVIPYLYYLFYSLIISVLFGVLLVIWVKKSREFDLTVVMGINIFLTAIVVWFNSAPPMFLSSIPPVMSLLGFSVDSTWLMNNYPLSMIVIRLPLPLIIYTGLSMVLTLLLGKHSRVNFKGVIIANIILASMVVCVFMLIAIPIMKSQYTYLSYPSFLLFYIPAGMLVTWRKGQFGGHPPAVGRSYLISPRLK